MRGGCEEEEKRRRCQPFEETREGIRSEDGAHKNVCSAERRKSGLIAKPMPKASVAPGSSVLLKAVAPSMTGVSKTMVIVSASRAGVLRIYTENKGRLQLRLPQCKGNKRGLMLGLLRPPPPLIKFWCDHKLR
jgi:hypothetical protein